MQKMCVTILQDLRAASLLHKGPTRAAVHPSKIFDSSHSWRRSRYKNFFFQLKWVPEIREDSPKAPIILVGTKVDLHQNAGKLSDSTRCKSNFVPSSHHHRFQPVQEKTGDKAGGGEGGQRPEPGHLPGLLRHHPGRPQDCLRRGYHCCNRATEEKCR